MIRQGRTAIGIDGWAAVRRVTWGQIMNDKPWRNPDAPRVINPDLDDMSSPPANQQTFMFDLREVRAYEAGKRPRTVSRDPREDPNPGDLLNDREIAFVMDRSVAHVRRKRETGELPTEPLENTCGVPHTRRDKLEEAFKRNRRPGPGPTPGRERFARAMKEHPNATLTQLATAAELTRAQAHRYKDEIESGTVPTRSEAGKDRLRRILERDQSIGLDALEDETGLTPRVLRRYLNQLSKEGVQVPRVPRGYGKYVPPSV